MWLGRRAGGCAWTADAAVPTLAGVRWLSRGIGDASGLILLVLGLGLAAIALFVEDREAVSATALVLGFVLVVGGVLVERLEGPIEMTSTGFKGQLREAQRDLEADALQAGVPPDEARALLDEAVERVEQLERELERTSIESTVRAVLSAEREKEERGRAAARRLLEIAAQSTSSNRAEDESPVEFASEATRLWLQNLRRSPHSQRSSVADAWARSLVGYDADGLDPRATSRATEPAENDGNDDGQRSAKRGR